MKSVSQRQIIPQLRRLLRERGVEFEVDHGFHGTSRVDLFISCRPPIVVHVCERATLRDVDALLRHRQRSKGSYLRSTQVPVVHPLFREEPSARTRVALESRGITFEVLRDDPVALDDLAEIADRIAERYEFQLEEQRRREELEALARSRSRVRRSASGAIEAPAPRPFDTIADVLDEMQGLVRALGEDAVASTAADFGLAEDEYRHEHYPACVLHLARGSEALVLHLADRWKALPDRHLLREMDAIRGALDQLGERLAELRGTKLKAKRMQLEGRARKQGVQLVDRILELLLDGGTTRDDAGEDRRTVRSALGDIKRCYRHLAVVREAIDALDAEASFTEMLALRNAIAHARAGGRDFDALCVLQQLQGMLALLGALGTIRDAIEAAPGA